MSHWSSSCVLLSGEGPTKHRAQWVRICSGPGGNAQAPSLGADLHWLLQHWICCNICGSHAVLWWKASEMHLRGASGVFDRLWTFLRHDRCLSCECPTWMWSSLGVAGSFTTKLVYVREDNWHDKKYHLQGLLLVWPKTQLVVSDGGGSLTLFCADQRFCHHPKNSPTPSQFVGKSVETQTQQMSLPQPCLCLFRPEMTGLQ